VVVLDPEGVPVSGAAVTLAAHPAYTDSRSAPTDADGVARFDGLEPEEHGVTVRAAGFAAWHGTVEVAEGREARLRVELVRLVEVSGRVLLPDGGPAPGAAVEARAGGAAEGKTVVAVHTKPLAETTADHEGRFRIALEPGRVTTLAARSLPHAEGTTSLVPRTPRDDVTLRLRAGGRLTGRVIAPDGSPAAGALVFVVPDMPEFLARPRQVLGPAGHATWWEGGEETDEGPMILSEAEVEGEVHAPRILRADAEGAFEVAGLPLPSHLRVLAEGRDGARGGSASLHLDERSAAARADVLLEPRVELVVRLEAPDGSEPTGVSTVRLLGSRDHFLEPRGDPAPHELPGAPESGPEQRFRGLLPGRYVLEVHVAGCVPERREVEVAATGTSEVVVRGRAGLTVAGVVREADGTVVEGVRGTLWVEARGRVLTQQVEATSDAQGRVAWHGVQDAPFSVQLQSDSHLDRRLEVLAHSASPFTFLLERRHEVRFRLALPDGEAAPDGVWVAEHDGSSAMSRYTARGPDGTYRHPARSNAARASFAVLPRGRAPVLLGRIALPPGEVTDAGRLVVDDGREVAGTVRDAAGRPVAGVRISAEAPGARGLLDGVGAGPYGETSTDHEGRYRLRRLPHEPVEVHARHDRLAPARGGAGRGASEVDLRLEEGSFLEVSPGPGDTSSGLRGWVHLREVSGAGEADLVLPLEAGASVRFGPLAAGEYEAALQVPGAQHVPLGRVTLRVGERRLVEWKPR
jgi:hypothetical protein